MLWMTDLEWSFIGNDNGAGVVYCYGKHTELFMTKQRGKKKHKFFCYGFLFWLLLFSMHIDTCEQIFVSEQGLNHQLFQVVICWQPPSRNA